MLDGVGGGEDVMTHDLERSASIITRSPFSPAPGGRDSAVFSAWEDGNLPFRDQARTC